MKTLFSTQAHDLATRAEQAVDWQRRDGITHALRILTNARLSGVLGDLRRDEALHVLLRSVHRQAVLAGVNIPYTALSHARAAS